INAAQNVMGKDPFVLTRSEAYIGVLIDDLITKSTDEPYRMFTSRAEYRTLLRQDNADERLTPLSHKIGLAKDERMFLVEQKLSGKQEMLKYLNNLSVEPTAVNPVLNTSGSPEVNQKVKFTQILSRPQIDLKSLLAVTPDAQDKLDTYGDLSEAIAEQIEIQIKYEGYLAKEKELAEKMNRLENVPLPQNFNYNALTSLSMEARQKLSLIRPETLGQASRISGVNPSDISIIG
ncbi:MAG: tRNA uridine 5-carboxymethylaminomethyl modification protein, partial [Bacteroidota bacterium]